MSDAGSDVAKFMGVTGADEAAAQHFLAACGGDVNAAISQFFAASSPDQDQADAPRLGTVSVQGGSGAAPPGDDKKKSEELFVGGGQAVVHGDGGGAGAPGDASKSELFKIAKDLGAKSHEEDRLEREKFKGDGRKLEGSEFQQKSRPEEHVKITVWKNGMTIDDGDLIDPESPEAQQFMAQLKARQVPKMVVQKLRKEGKEPSQLEVVLTMQDNHGQDYVKQFKAFTGTGRTLGGPAPAPAPAPGAAESEPAGLPEVDESKETTQLQITLPGGQRQKAVFNLTNTVGDIAQYVRHHCGGSVGLMTPFPRKELTDMSQTIQEAGLARAAVVAKKL